MIKGRSVAFPLALGLLLAVADALMAPRFQGVIHPPPWPLRMSILLAIPAALVTLAALVGALGRVGPPATGGALGAWIGHAAARGGHARTLPLAPHWWWMAAVLGAWAGWVLVARRARHHRVVPIRLALGMAGLGVLVLSAIAYRGLYAELRMAATALGAALLAGALRHPSPPGAFSPRAMLPAVGAAALLWVAAWPGLADGEARDWARRAGTAAAVPPGLLAPWLPSEDHDVEQIAWAPAPYVATPLYRQVQEELDRKGLRPRGVLLIVIDALRADVVEERNTPHLLERARRGLYARRAYSPSAASHLTLVSALSGLYPNRIAAIQDGWNRVSLVTERLRRFHVKTRALFPSVLHNLRSPGFRRLDLGFDVATQRDHRRGDPPPSKIAELLFPAASTEGPWFSYLHLITPHAPYDQGGADGAPTDKERYCAEVRVADALMEDVLTELERRGLADSTWIIVTADHGEEFGEHGGVRHATQLFEESIHVPLMVSGPGLRSGELPGVVSLVGLAPTLEDVFGLPPQERPPYAGRSWLPLILGLDDPGRPSFVLSELPALGSDFLPVKSAVLQWPWKAIVEERQGHGQLFRLDEDPRETDDVASENPAILGRLWGLSKAVREPGGAVAAAPPTPPEEMLPADLATFENPEITRRSALIMPLRWGNLPPEHVLRLLALFLHDGDPEVAIILEKSSTRLAGPLREAAQALLRWVLEKDRADDAGRLIRLYRTTDDAFVQSSLLAAFDRREDGRLRSVPRRTPAHTALVADLAEARYRATFGERPDEALMRRGLGHLHPWVRRLAVEVAAAAPDGHVGILEEALRPERSTMMRIAALRGLARRHRWRPVLEAAADADDEVAATALEILFSAGPPPPGVRRRKLHRVVPAQPIPLDLGAVEPGTTVGVMLQGAPVLLPRPKFRWERNGHEHGEEARRAPRPRAVRLEVAPGRGPVSLRFPGRPGDLLLGGWITVAPPR